MGKYKQLSARSANAIGEALRAARVARNFTLKKVASDVGVDHSQISRFERGDVKYASQNLQVYANYLQIELSRFDDMLEERFRQLASRSPEHRKACELILDALEQLQAR